jgi:hopanoid biosynthesis associated RND transporter like protein HpnN
MLTSAIVRIVGSSVRHAWATLALGLLLAAGASAFTATHFRLNSNIDALLSNKLEWRQRDIALERAFGNFNLIEAVVEAPTPELTEAATVALTQALAADKAHFRGVSNPGATEFFASHSFLFMAKDHLETMLGGLAEGEALIEDLASDQSLRGLVAGLEDSLLGVGRGRLKLDDLARPLNQASDTLDEVLAGRPASFSWRVLMQGKPAAPRDLRGYINVQPALDFGALQPGLPATEALRAIAADVLPKYQSTLRLTGTVTMDDEQFGTIKENAVRNGLITLAIVTFILWLALRSWRLMAAIAVNLYLGLALTAALGLMMVGAFNLISVYFSVLFVGIGVDFGIQFSVRYRSERHEIGDLVASVQSAGSRVGAPLTLAAFATAAGFLSFLPTSYKGVSELGLIAGCGMLIAFATTITLLPALIVLLNPPGEPKELGYSSLAPIDEFLNRRRIGIIAGTAIVVAAGAPLLYWLHFDSNPISLQNPKTEAIATYLELSRDPSANTDAIQVLASSLDQADAIGARVAKLPEVSSVITLSSFVPQDQAAKLPIIQNAADKLAAAFDPQKVQSAPTDAENVDALNEGAQRLTEAASDQEGPGADSARRLSLILSKLAQAPKSARDGATDSFFRPLTQNLEALRASLQPAPITRQSLPPELTQNWVTPDGRARVSISPKADPNDNDAMSRFANAVLAVEPDATSGPITILEAGKLVVGAFIEAGALALLSIAILLWLVLQRVGDVLLTLIPLALAGVVTLELTVLVNLPLNFANIIALPLLLGVGVAFKIYYIMAWREGQTHLLQTPLTRAVIYSALTTATAFGSLIFSSHPGTSSMGKLLALSLVSTLAAAALFQPILMGKPRNAPPPSER